MSRSQMPPHFSLKALIRLLRPHQWMKNLLTAVPVISAHRWAETGIWGNILLLMLSLSLAASALYVVNDLLDVKSDRLHPVKCRRPIATGEITVLLAVITAIVLMGGAVAVAALISATATYVVLAYAASSAIYSLWLKRVPLADIVALALLYGFRIVAGGVCVGIPLSDWLLTFAFFVFLSLAAAKRLGELLLITEKAGESSISFRGYDSQDASFVQGLGIATAFAAVIILCLYLQSDAVRLLYAQPRLLWLTIPLFTFWICRLWRVTVRGKMHADPVIYVLRDRQTYAFALVVASLLMLAKPVVHAAL